MGKRESKLKLKPTPPKPKPKWWQRFGKKRAPPPPPPPTWREKPWEKAQEVIMPYVSSLQSAKKSVQEHLKPVPEEFAYGVAAAIVLLILTIVMVSRSRRRRKRKQEEKKAARSAEDVIMTKEDYSRELGTEEQDEQAAADDVHEYDDSRDVSALLQSPSPTITSSEGAKSAIHELELQSTPEVHTPTPRGGESPSPRRRLKLKMLEKQRADQHSDSDSSSITVPVSGPKSLSPGGSSGRFFKALAVPPSVPIVIGASPSPDVSQPTQIMSPIVEKQTVVPALDVPRAPSPPNASSPARKIGASPKPSVSPKLLHIMTAEPPQVSNVSSRAGSPRAGSPRSASPPKSKSGSPRAAAALIESEGSSKTSAAEENGKSDSPKAIKKSGSFLSRKKASKSPQSGGKSSLESVAIGLEGKSETSQAVDEKVASQSIDSILSGSKEVEQPAKLEVAVQRTGSFLSRKSKSKSPQGEKKAADVVVEGNLKTGAEETPIAGAERSASPPSVVRSSSFLDSTLKKAKARSASPASRGKTNSAESLTVDVAGQKEASNSSLVTSDPIATDARPVSPLAPIKSSGSFLSLRMGGKTSPERSAVEVTAKPESPRVKEGVNTGNGSVSAIGSGSPVVVKAVEVAVSTTDAEISSVSDAQVGQVESKPKSSPRNGSRGKSKSPRASDRKPDMDKSPVSDSNVRNEVDTPSTKEVVREGERSPRVEEQAAVVTPAVKKVPVRVAPVTVPAVMKELGVDEYEVCFEEGNDAFSMVGGPNHSVVVSPVLEGGQAYAKGVRDGDQVIAVDSQEVKSLGTALGLVSIASRPMIVRFKKAPPVRPPRPEALTMPIIEPEHGSEIHSPAAPTTPSPSSILAMLSPSRRNSLLSSGQRKGSSSSIRSSIGSRFLPKKNSISSPVSVDGSGYFGSPLRSPSTKDMLKYGEELAQPEDSFDEKMRKGCLVVKWSTKGVPLHRVLFISDEEGVPCLAWRDLKDPASGSSHKRARSLSNILKKDRESFDISSLQAVVSGDEEDVFSPGDYGNADLRLVTGAGEVEGGNLDKSLSLIFEQRSIQVTCFSKEDMLCLVDGFRKLQNGGS